MLLAARDGRLRERIYKEYPRDSFELRLATSFRRDARSRIRADADVDAQASVEGVRAASAILDYLEANAPESVKLSRDLEPYRLSKLSCPR